MSQSNRTKTSLRVVRPEGTSRELDKVGGHLPALRELCRPLVASTPLTQERGFKRMKNTSFAFQTAFTALDGLDDKTKDLLEEKIPEKTSIKVGLDAYQRLAREVLCRDPVKGRAEIYEGLRKVGYGITKTGDIEAGMHSHPEPHWLRVLSIVRDAVILSHKSDREKIEQAMEGNTNGWGNRIKDIIVECAVADRLLKKTG